VATDSEEVVQECRGHDVEAIMTSPAHATGTDRLAEIVIRHKISEDTIVVNVQGDEPLMPPELIRACARLLAARPDCAIATAAFPLHNGGEFLNPNIVKVALDEENRALYFSRAPIPWPREHQITIKGDLPEGLPALRHIGIYAYRASFLKQFPTLEVPAIETFECLEQLRALANGYRIAVHRARTAPPPGVDTLEDLHRVRQVLAQAK
jgi:3-deoxy-manno-octulosonate cytidylyltransferase (CMP-KDO synthetase)